jgi:superfamily II DNA/RNA helicase
MISVIQRLKSQADGTSPRVMIFVKDRDAAMRLERAFEPLLFRCDLRLLTAIDQHDLLGQRDTLFDGVDILIGTPTRLSKLFFTNALNTARIQMLWVTDADEYIPKTGSTEIVRISQSIDRCQKLLMYTKSHPKIKQLRQDLMPRAQLVQIDPSTD